MDEERLTRAERVLGHVFGDRSLLRTALTHPSAAAEGGGASYDRLEFLGDSVLGFLVADHLFKTLPHASEGELTARKVALINGAVLADIALRCGIGELVEYGKGERASTRGRATALENALEALIGAVYADAGLAPTRRVVRRLFGDLLDAADLVPSPHPKSLLAEWAQARAAGTPTYRVVATQGPDHARWFTVEAVVGGRVAGTGSGPSKRAAETAAAQAALEALSAEDEAR